jgi:hypothetical protein
LDLLQALPALRQRPALRGKAVSLIGVSTILLDDAAYYFEIAKPRQWVQLPEGTTRVGIGAIGGTLEAGESVIGCLRREAQEELGVRVAFQAPARTYLIQGAGGAASDEWRVADEVALAPSKKRPVPWMVLLFAPRLGGPGTPDLLAICAFRSGLGGAPALGDLFGLLRIERAAVPEVFARAEWPLAALQALPGVTLAVSRAWPTRPILRPVLTARAFQVVVRQGLL